MTGPTLADLFDEITSEYSKESLLWRIAPKKRREVQNQMLVLPEFIKKMTNSMDKQ